MTREEAIKRLSKYVNNGFYTIEHQETCAMAIAALREQEIAKDTNVLTNADHIRSMTDEELAKFLLEIMSNSVCFGEGMFPYHPCPQDQNCEKCGLGWLKQPYEEEV